MLLGACLLAAPVLGTTTAWPHDVGSFLARRAACDHWRGEEATDAQRQAQIVRALCRDCTGTDAELRRLKARYARDARVSAALADLEPQVESPDRRETRRLCKAALGER